MSSILNDLRGVAVKSIDEGMWDDERFLLALTREIAMEMDEVEVILKRFGVSPEDFNRLAVRPRFVALLREQTITWGSSLSVESRIKTKMQYMVEQSLPELFKELVKEGLSAPKVELVKTLMKGGSIGVDVREGAQAERVNITINMGAERVEVSRPITIDHDAEEAA